MAAIFSASAFAGLCGPACSPARRRRNMVKAGVWCVGKVVKNGVNKAWGGFGKGISAQGFLVVYSSGLVVHLYCAV